jgi:hypothetical protein
MGYWLENWKILKNHEGMCDSLIMNSLIYIDLWIDGLELGNEPRVYLVLSPTSKQNKTVQKYCRHVLAKI